MAASVLFDAPGPKTVARHRLYTIISSMVLLVIAAGILFQLERKGQFAYALWEPFVTPGIVQLLLKATGQTLAAAAIAILCALALGMLLGTGKLSDHRAVRWPAWTIVEFFRAVPLLLVIIATWYFIGAQPGLTGFVALVLGLILYNAAVFAEILRAGINAVPNGQSEAAFAIGMTKSAVMRIILLPQAVKIMLPSLISQAIVALKDTSLGYAVLAPGLTYAGKSVFRTFNNTIQTAIVLALIYIIVNLFLTWLATLAQKRYVGERPGEIAAAQPDGGASGAGGGALSGF